MQGRLEPRSAPSALLPLLPAGHPPPPHACEQRRSLPPSPRAKAKGTALRVRLFLGYRNHTPHLWGQRGGRLQMDPLHRRRVPCFLILWPGHDPDGPGQLLPCLHRGLGRAHGPGVCHPLDSSRK